MGETKISPEALQDMREIGILFFDPSMKDLQSTRAMWLKGWLFLLIGVVSAALLLMEDWSWRRAGLLMLCVWGFSRAYYFAFYVIERWVDPQFKFSGLGHFITWWWRKKR